MTMLASAFLTIQPEQLAAELTERRRFMLWQGRRKPNGKWDKIPCRADGRFGDATQPDDWVTFAEALAAHNQGIGHGITRCLYKADKLTGIDVDGVVEWANGAPLITTTGREVMALFPPTYWELSPSGKGIRGFVLAPKPAGAGAKRGQFEAYDELRHLTLTGHRLEGTADTLASGKEAAAAVAAFCARYLADAPAQSVPATLAPAPRPTERAGSAEPSQAPTAGMSDAELIGFLRANLRDEDRVKFPAAFDTGDLSPWGGDASAADFYALRKLAYVTDRDEGRIERIFQTLPLYRPERWQDKARTGETYGAGSIREACYGVRGIKKSVSDYYRTPPAVVDLTGILDDAGDEPDPAPLANLERGPDDAGAILHCVCCERKTGQIEALQEAVRMLSRRRDQVNTKLQSLARQMRLERDVLKNQALKPAEKPVALAAVREVYRKGGAGAPVEVYVGERGKGGIADEAGVSRRTAMATIEKLDRVGVWESRPEPCTKRRADGSEISYTRVFITPKAETAASALEHMAQFSNAARAPGESPNGLGGTRKHCNRHPGAAIDTIGICRRCNTVVNGGEHHADLEGGTVRPPAPALRMDLDTDAEPEQAPGRTCAEKGCTVRAPETAGPGWACEEHFISHRQKVLLREPTAQPPRSNLADGPLRSAPAPPAHHASRADQEVLAVQVGYGGDA